MKFKDFLIKVVAFAAVCLACGACTPEPDPKPLPGIDDEDVVAAQQSQHQADQQSAHDDSRDTIDLEEFYPFYDGPAYQNHRCRYGAALHHVKGQLYHK